MSQLHVLGSSQNVGESPTLHKMYCREYFTCNHASHLFCYRTDHPSVFCRLDHWQYMCTISEFEVLVHEAAFGGTSATYMPK